MTNTFPPPPPVIGGRYRVLRELGRGGFGAVYLVEHTNTGDRLALKVLYGAAARDPMSLERFKREARASSRIRSDNVVRVIDADAAPELEGAPYLVMELLEGKDVEQLVEARGALLPEEVVGILSQAARALDRAHALGIVHRDLKPENMFLHTREDGGHILKILDFGISKSLGESGGDIKSAGLTTTGAVLGTPLYMAPEQARGLTSSIAPATDVWAMGLIAYRLLTGDVYWKANTIADLLVQIVATEMPRPSTVSVLLPPAFDAWFFRSCNRDASARFRTVGEQVNALASALGVTNPALPTTDAPPLSALRPLPPAGSTGGALAHTASTLPRTRKPMGLLVVSGAGALVVLGGAIFFATRSASLSQPSPTTPTMAALSVAPAASSPAVPSSPPPPPVVVTPSVSTSASVAPVSPPQVAGKKPGPRGEVSGSPPPVVTPVASAPPAKTAPPRRFDPEAP